jgi:hypothetical protein
VDETDRDLVGVAVAGCRGDSNPARGWTASSLGLLHLRHGPAPRTAPLGLEHLEARKRVSHPDVSSDESGVVRDFAAQPDVAILATDNEPRPHRAIAPWHRTRNATFGEKGLSKIVGRASTKPLDFGLKLREPVELRRNRGIAGPSGSENRIRSRGGTAVLVDQPAEQIPSANVARTDRYGVPRFGSWRGEAEGAMRALPVVVLNIGPQRAIEMPPTEDEGPIEALGPDRLDHALRLRLVVSLRLLAVPAVRGGSSSPTRSIP